MSENADIVVNTVDESPALPEEPRSPSPTPSLAETVAETVANTKKQQVQKRARTITSVNRVEFSESLQRVTDTYAAPLLGGEPLCILTPPVVLKDVLVDEDGDTTEYTRIKLKRVYGDAFKQLEDRLLQTAKDRKVTWFQNEDLPDEFLEGAMKRFYDPASKTLTVRIDDDVGGRLNTPAGSRVRCVLELHSAVFTRTQFGALWTLTLVKAASRDEEAYLFDPEEDSQHESITTHDLMSCLVHKDLKSSPDDTVPVDDM
jgi:hypothetical protein